MKASWCDIHQSSLLRLIKCIVHQSPVLRLPRVLRQTTLLRHLLLHYSPISSVAIPRVLHQSTLLRLLQVHHSPISSVTSSTRVAPISSVAPSTSVEPIITVVLLQFHHSTVLLHFLAAILCHVIMLLSNSILSIILLPMWIRLVDYLTASLKSKFVLLQKMLPPVDTFILQSWFSFIN